MKKKIPALLLSGVLSLSLLSTAAFATVNLPLEGNKLSGLPEDFTKGTYPLKTDGGFNSYIGVDTDGTIGTDAKNAIEGAKSASIRIGGVEYIIKEEPTTDLTVKLDQETATVKVNETVTLIATPSDLTAELSWKSNDTSVATVDDNGTVKGIAAGKTTITVTAKKDDKTAEATCEVTVTDDSQTVAVTGVTLDQRTASVEVDRTLQLNATVKPDDASNKKVFWSSDKTNIATVDDYGVVTGVAVGTATITARTEDGDFTATCTVTVTPRNNGGNNNNSGSSSNGTSGSSSPAIKPLPDRNQGTTTPANPGTTTPTPEFFTDVPATHWAAGAISWVSANGYMRGMSNNTFNPDGLISRQQMWMILARIAGSDPANMAAARTWAMGRNLTDGTGPALNMSRQQLVTFLYRFAQRQGFTISGSSPLTTFPDNANVADYAQAPMSWAVANGLVAGKSDGRLDPTGTATRAQFATILQRFFTNIVNKNA